MANKKGPLTTGEANALVAIITGCDAEQVAGWTVIAAVNGMCETHPDSQQVITSTNLKREVYIQMMGKSLIGVGEGDEIEAS